MRRAQHSRGRSRASAVLLVLTLALGQLGAMLHATALHARCAEHGELIHTDGTVEGGVARGLNVWFEELARQGASDELRGLPAAGDHDHDHCLATCATRDRALSPVDPAAAVLMAEAREVTVRAHVERAAARPIHRIAPKNSPPA
ncbi:MAG TPA: hypothetical protein VMZ28_18550 [Kofleriaceae bacterium]|nr:hypothetical protein [Kofleriaceae bacterium]